MDEEVDNYKKDQVRVSESCKQQAHGEKFLKQSLRLPLQSFMTETCLYAPLEWLQRDLGVVQLPEFD